MIIKFEIRNNVKQLTIQELEAFEQTLPKELPNDYKQHMLQYNGGSVVDKNIKHKDYPDNIDTGLNYLIPIKYGSNTVEDNIQDLSVLVPQDYLAIGTNAGGGYVIMSLKNDSTYGEIQEIYPDEEQNYMSPSFTDYLEAMVEQEDHEKPYL